MIFLSNAKNLIEKVYTKKLISTIPVYNWEELLSNADTVKDTEYIFSTWGMPSVSIEDINKYLPKLKAVFYAAGSVQYFVRPFLAVGVRVFSAWAYNAKPVAEFTISQILLANKGYFQLPGRYARSVADNAENKDNLETRSLFRSYHESFPGNFKTKVGIIGAGMVGRYVIKLLKQFELEILVFDPFLPDEKAEEMDVKKTSLAEIFTECQTISNHLANNKETENMLNYELFKLMKDNATFINTGRGAQVEMDGLARILKEKPGVTALLDVTDPNEPLPVGSLLFDLPNMFVTPHRAGAINREVEIMGIGMFEEYENFINGKALRYEVKAEMLETMA